MDRAAMDGDAHGTSLAFSREHISRRPSASIKNSRTLSGAMVVLFVLGMTLIVHGQEEQARQPPERLPAQVAVETFPLEPAPKLPNADNAKSRTGDETKTRKAVSASSTSAVRGRIPGSPGASKASQEEGNPTMLELPADRNALRVETIERPKQYSAPSAGLGTNNPVSEPLDGPVKAQSDSTAGKDAIETAQGDLDDPLEQYRARRRAEILELEARVVKNEQALTVDAHPALEEQHALADRAEADFVQIKQLLVDGNVSRLDALRLNNDFRRIGPERDRILQNELTSIETQLQYYENTLTSVELELIEDSLAVQAEHDAVLERLAPQRHSQARSDFAELERSYKAVLARQKVALTKLAARASETLDQVTRRLRVLEEEYGFIRTHIFWVRDQEPLGLATVQHVGRELKRLVKGMLTLAEESSDRKSWAHPSSEFLTAAVAAVILPLGLFRLRRLLRRRITRALPPSHLHGNQVKLIKVDMSHAIKRT